MSNNPPVANYDTASLSVIGSEVVTGNILANDTDPAGLPLQVVSVNNVTVSNTTTIIGADGTLVISPDGDYTYVINASSPGISGLSGNAIITDTFDYTISDGATYTTTTTELQQNLLSQSEAFNASPWVNFGPSGSVASVAANVAAGPNGGAATADQVTLYGADSGLYAVTNVSGQYTFSVWVKLVSGSATFSLSYYSGSNHSEDFETITATGTWQRVTLTFQGDGNANSNVALMMSPSQSTTGTFQFWGAQLNAGAAADTYVATTGSPISSMATITTPIVVGSSLAIEISENSAPPIAVADAATVIEDGNLVATGNVLSNDTGPAGDPLSVTAVNGIAITSTTTITGTYGTLIIAPSGSYTYTLANNQANVRSLSNGQVVADSFSYTLSDGQTYTTTTTQVLQNLLTQSEAFNTAPWTIFKTSGTAPTVTANVASGPNGGASTADQVTFSTAASGIYAVTNVSGQYTFSVWVKLVSGSGAFSLNYYSGSTNTNDLETVVATGTWQRVSLTFTGDGNANSNVALLLSSSQSSAGTLQFWGAQINAGAIAGPYVATTGSAITTTGTVTTPVVIGSTLSVDVTGDQVAPVAVPDIAAVTEDGNLVSTGNVLTNDTGPAAYPLSVTAVNGIAITGTTTIVGAYGTLVIAPDGSYTYTLADNQADVRSLSNGQVATDVFTYSISDGLPYAQTTTQPQQNFITQSEAFNASSWSTINPAGGVPIIIQPNVASGPNGGAATADQIDLPGPGAQISTATSLAGTYTFSVWVRLVSGSGKFALEYYAGATAAAVVQIETATSTWQEFSLTFNGDGNAASYVAIMQTLYEAGAGVYQLWGAQINAGTNPLPYVATTGTIVNTTTSTTVTAPASTLTVDVTGATPAAVADTASVSVQGTQTASGNLLSNDTSPADTTLSVLSVNGVAVNGVASIQGVYGTLTVQSNGQYTYVLNASAPIVQTLVGGQVAEDAFSYTLSNGLTYDTTTNSIAENLITQSQIFNTSPWVTFGSSSATTNQLTISAANSGILYTTNVAGQYTFSIMIQLVSGNGNFSFNYYEASSGVSYIQTAVATSTWQQFTWTFTGDGNANSNVAILHSSSQSSAGVFQLADAELNPGALPDPYLASSGSATSASETAITPISIGSTLDVAVSGSDVGQSGPALNLPSGTEGAVVNLATGQMTTPLSILAFGDSITTGWTQQDWVSQANLTSEAGYRGPLWQTFVNNGMLVNIIGPNSNGPASLPDTANAGFPGATTAQLLERLPGVLAQQVPGAVLLMAGTNDLLQGVSQTTTIANLQSMINMIRAAGPSTQIYLATLTPLSATSVTSLNSAITAMAAQDSAAGENVTLVSMGNVPSSDIGTDGTHPTAAGYALIAQNWYNAILATQPDQGGTPGGTSLTISPSVANVVGSGGPQFLIGNSAANIITAGSGYSVLSGGGGNDTLVGGSGVDQFDLSAVAGNVTIFNFNPNQGDFLDWKGIPGLTSAAALSTSETQSGGQTVINLQPFGVNGQVTLENYTGPLTNSLFT